MISRTHSGQVGVAMQTYGAKLTDEQEVLMHLADIAIDVYSAESATLRASSSTTRPCGSTHRRGRRSPR